MLETNHGLTRRSFLKTTVGAIGAAALPLAEISAQTSAKYTRYNVMSNGGKKALASYAKGVEAMLKLSPDHPQNWFRNAFIHLMDCPHGNWWFYVWHRAYLGYFEQTIRNLSGDNTFAIPYWDWTTLPQIPDAMFEGVLSPADIAFEPYTRNLAVFTSFIRPAMESYWKTLKSEQVAQLNLRGYSDFDKVWNDVTGYDPINHICEAGLKVPPHGVSGNMAYANPCGSRYLTRDNPKLDDKTAYNVSPFVVYAGLLATEFYNQENNLSFNSSKGFRIAVEGAVPILR
jgi:tyrosinase